MTIAALTKTMPIRLWDVSAGGCLLEFREFVPVGTVGALAVELDGRRHVEFFRVCRVHGDEGRRTRCLVGAEFLTLSPPRQDSLRAAIARLRGRPLPVGIPMLAGRSSGDTGKSSRPRKTRGSAVLAGHHAERADLNSSCNPLELAAPLLSGSARACPKPEKE